MLLLSVVLDSEVEQLKTKLASVNGQLYIIIQFLVLNRRVVVLIYGVLFLFFFLFSSVWLVFEVSVEFWSGMPCFIHC